MFRRILMLSLLVLVVGGGVASAQTFSARRMAMGGAILAGGGAGGSGANVAYRAVPKAPSSGWTVPLPIGLVQLLADPPETDPDSPDFNVYELANLLYNPPWNLQLSSPEVPGNDITIEIGRDHLAVDLGDVKNVFPREQSRMGAVVNGPAPGFGIKRFFLAAAPLVHYENDLSFNDNLRDVIDGDELRTNTRYEIFDQGLGQAAVGVHLGWAGPLMRAGDPRGKGMGLYAGARVKLMRGLAYASTDNSVVFATGDTLFGADPLDANLQSHSYTTGPEGGGLGRGLDLGAVWMAGGVEIGLGVNDIGTTFDWRVKETWARDDTTEVVATDAPLTSTVPTTAVANAAMRIGRFLVAGDIVRGIHVTTGHLGAETWLGKALALRAGASVDANELIQYSGGAGLRLGNIGVDLAVASHSRNLSRERGLELGAGLTSYH
ncbi:MAG: hypothetical protein E4H17_00325 [Gemmatimonadales bacterium]|nr:MAG: hypothetical protein E4H17_00325 [Gemmatimonadales bacterium]